VRFRWQQLVARAVETFEELILLAETALRQRGLIATGERVVVVGGIPARQPRGTNFLKVHTVS